MPCYAFPQGLVIAFLQVNLIKRLVHLSGVVTLHLLEERCNKGDVACSLNSRYTTHKVNLFGNAFEQFIDLHGLLVKVELDCSIVKVAV